MTSLLCTGGVTSGAAAATPALVALMADSSVVMAQADERDQRTQRRGQAEAIRLLRRVIGQSACGEALWRRLPAQVRLSGLELREPLTPSVEVPIAEQQAVAQKELVRGTRTLDTGMIGCRGPSGRAAAAPAP